MPLFVVPLSLQDIDECGSGDEVCSNGGTCQNLNGTFACLCTSGFSGDVCEHDTDECLSAPCKNGACQNLHNRYACNCSAGFTGRCSVVGCDQCQAADGLFNKAA